MPRAILCSSCRHWVNLPDDHAGGSATCARCGASVPVPVEVPRGAVAGEEAIQVELAEHAGAGRVTRRKPRRRATCPDCGKDIPAQARWCPHCDAPLDEDRREEDEDDRDERRERRPRWKPCPHCGCARADQVTFTFWGSFYGPSLLSHVRCRKCGYAYNGRTGKSNFWPAFFFVLVPALLILAVVGGLILWIWHLASGAV